MSEHDRLTDTENVELPSLGLVYEEAKYVLNVQLDQIDKLNTKAGLVLGAGGIILTVLFRERPASITLAQGVILLTAGLLITLSAAVAIWSLGVLLYHIVPEPKVLRDKYINKPVREVKLIVLDTLLETIDLNERLIDGKTSLVKWGLRLLGMGAILFGGSFLYNVAIVSPIWGVVECLMKIGSQR